MLQEHIPHKIDTFCDFEQSWKFLKIDPWADFTSRKIVVFDKLLSRQFKG